MNDFQYLLIAGLTVAFLLTVGFLAAKFIPTIPAVARAIVNFKAGRSGISKDFDKLRTRIDSL